MVSVLTITYGDRWHLLKQVLSHLISDKNVSHILVVNNGVTYNISKAVDSLSSTKVELLNLDSNYGSSKAYSLGLQHLLKKTQKGLVWLLDDDNLPTINALDILLKHWELHTHFSSNNSLIALLSIRENRRYLVNISNGQNVNLNFPYGNRFLGFNLLEFPSIIIQREEQQKIITKSASIYQEIKIPMAPFGGLLFNLSSLESIGFPNEDFFLYCDDFEFTYRFTKNKGEIWLIPESVVNDIDKSFTIDTKHTFLRPKYLDQLNYRSYFFVRNFTYFAKTNLVNNKLIFVINIVIYLLYLGILSIFSGKFKEFNLFFTAVKHGYREDLKDHKLLKSKFI